MSNNRDNKQPPILRRMNAFDDKQINRLSQLLQAQEKLVEDKQAQAPQPGEAPPAGNPDHEPSEEEIRIRNEHAELVQLEKKAEQRILDDKAAERAAAEKAVNDDHDIAQRFSQEFNRNEDEADAREAAARAALAAAAAEPAAVEPAEPAAAAPVDEQKDRPDEKADNANNQDLLNDPQFAIARGFFNRRNASLSESNDDEPQQKPDESKPPRPGE